MQRRAVIAASFLLAFVAAAGLNRAAVAQSIAPVIQVDHGPNDADQVNKHYVVLVSLDGFRFDYAKKYGAKHLLAMARSGASAPEGMIPSYPSVTFPNHYTLVTGLYPEHHGIVAMSFYDPVRGAKYAFDDPRTATDGSWYGGVPLWSLAEKQGMRSACFFWPGSEAEIAGERPSFYLKYDDSFPDEKRVDQVLSWLALPDAKRPHFITLYYSGVDHAGHRFGPDAPETREAVRHVDEMVGRLHDRLARTHLPVDLIVVSDHGMATEKGSWVNLDKFADLSNFETAGALLYSRSGSEHDVERVYQQLKSASGDFKVYRRAKVPADLEFNSSVREGDPVIVPTGPFAIRAHAAEEASKDLPPSRGVHGYDPREMPEMRAIFYAEGPDIRGGVVLRPFENVNLYPFIAQLLGLEAPPTDGKLSVLEGMLKGSAPVQ